jgi:hypothetical protein
VGRAWQNSGDLNSTAFSNNARSLKSSLGVFVTEDTYDGHNGYSLRVRGLERGFNDNAMSREVVFHGADYANPTIARGLGRLGRSWGCFAVGRNVSASLINTIKHKTVVVAYYPDPRWLHDSVYLIKIIPRYVKYKPPLTSNESMLIPLLVILSRNQAAAKKVI